MWVLQACACHKLAAQTEGPTCGTLSSQSLTVQSAEADKKERACLWFHRVA